MKKQIMLLLSALLVVFSVFPALQSQAAEVTTQELEVAFDVLKADSDDKSTAGDFVKSPAKIAVEDGKTYAYVTLQQAKFWQSLKVQATQPGTFTEANFVDAVVVSEDTQANTRLVKFEVQDITKVLNVKAHIIVTGVPGIGEYDHTYDLRLKFDGSKTPATPEVNPEVKPDVKPEALKDGAYTIGFEALHETEDKASSMGRYIDASAALTAKDGKNFVALTLTNNEQITAFQVEQEDGKYVDATVIDTDEKADTRVVGFEVADLSAIMNAKVTVFVAAANHTGNYTVRLAFDQKSIKAATEEVATDGVFTIDFKALHEEEDKESSMTRYIETPAALTVKGGKNLVALTLTNNEQITAFQVEQDGKYVDATIVNIDEKTNTRVVSFEVADLAAIMNAKVTVFVAAANHTGNYTVRLAFDKDSVKAVATEEIVKFADIDKSWAKPYIEALAAKQIVKGKTATTFAPNDTITRAQFALMLSRALELPKQDFEGTFSDVTQAMDGIVFEIEAANRAGIIKGNEGKYNPNEKITRQQMVTMIIRAIEFKDASVLKEVTNAVVFTDTKNITAEAKKSIDLAAGLGIINGKEVKGQKVFEPQADATRAHASKMVYQLVEKLK